MNFDIFQTVGPNDFSIIKDTLKQNRKKIIGYDNIYLFSEIKSFDIKGVKNIHPSFFPFSINYIEQKMQNNKRAGWIYAQLVKLYYPYLQTKKEYILVLDSDVFFTKPIKFFNELNQPLFTVSDEHHIPYFIHMKKLHPEFNKNYIKSGISHHMILKKDLIKSMFAKVEDYHNKPFFEVFIEMLDLNENSPASEYEIYLNYVLNEHTDTYNTREINWKNTNKLNKRDFEKYSMISLPHYAGTRPNDFFKNIIKKDLRRALNSFINFIFLKFNKF